MWQEKLSYGNCTEKLCSRCDGRRHIGDVYPTSEKEAVLAMTGEVGARVDVGEDRTVQASAFKAGETGEHGNGFGKVGMGSWHGRSDTRPGLVTVGCPLT